MRDVSIVLRQVKRLPAARRYDRNCVLSATAAQIIAAGALGLEVAEIIVGKSVFDVGIVAKDIRLAAPQADRNTTVVAAAGVLGFTLAAGLSIEEINDGLGDEPRAVNADALALLLPWIDDGRFVRLVRILDGYRFGGRRALQ